jgi:hypothetical protein
MPTLRLTCPFCSEETRLELLRAATTGKPKLQEVREVLPVLLSRFSNVKPEAVQSVLTGHFTLFHSGALCPECDEVSIVKGVVFGAGEAIKNGSDPGVDYSDQITVLRHSPEPSTKLSDDIPSELREVFRELDEDLKRRRNAGRILAGCRSLLDVALRRLNQTSGSRADRIRALHKAGMLTADIAEWANRLWVDGNDGIHELDAKAHPVAEHVAFLRLFFEVCFVMPAKVKRATVKP